MSQINKLRFVVGMWGDCFWSASFHDFYAWLERRAVSSGYDMSEEPTFKELKSRPKWLQKPFDDDLWPTRDLPRGGYIEPLDWDENDFKEYLDELDQWHREQIKKAA